jgi:hypothetical protein
MPNQQMLEWVHKLREYDHHFLSPQGVKMFATAFGVKLRPYRAFANPQDPKGLTLNNGEKSAVGMDAADMAKSICEQLKVPYQFKMGRGFQLQTCCNALEQHFQKGGDQ